MFFIKNLREENEYLQEENNYLRATRSRDMGLFFLLGLVFGAILLAAGVKLKRKEGKELLSNAKQCGNDALEKLTELFHSLKTTVIRKKNKIEDEISDVALELEEKVEEIFEEENL